MDELTHELKTAGLVAALAAVAGGGLALGMGLRFISTLALVGLGTGVALGVALSAAPKLEASPPALT